MKDNQSNQGQESHFRRHKCPGGCGSWVYPEQKQCPRCKFDLTSWRRNWFNGMNEAFSKKPEDGKEI